jgi:tol-pal system protein YbgF
VAAVSAVGCGGVQKSVKSENHLLRAQVGQLRAQIRRDRGKKRDLENQIFILKDRVDTAELERDRAGPTVRLPVEVLAPDEAEVEAEASDGAGGNDSDYQVVGVDEDGVEIIYIGDAAKDHSVRPSMEMYEDSAPSPARASNPAPAPRLIEPPGPDDRIPVAANVPTIDNQMRHARRSDKPLRGKTMHPKSVEVDSAQALYKRYYAALRAGDHAQAISGFRGFVKRFPTHDYADNAQYWLGEAYYDQKRYKRAISEFRAVLDNYPRGNKVADALLKMGYCYAALGNEETARDLLTQVTELYPKSGPAKLAARRLVELNRNQE